MKNFKQRTGQSGFGPGRRGFSKPNFRSKFDRRDRQPVTMHSAICDDCGQKCEVPFRPTGDKPIYCNSCFGGKRNENDRSFGRGFPCSDSGKSDNGEIKRQLENINSKLDRLISSLERPLSFQPLSAGPVEKPAKDTPKKKKAAVKKPKNK